MIRNPACVLCSKLHICIVSYGNCENNSGLWEGNFLHFTADYFLTGPVLQCTTFNVFINTGSVFD